MPSPSVRFHQPLISELQKTLEQSIETECLREIGNLASWTVSSAKEGFTIDELRDESLDGFWQSDGPQPHYVNIHFAKRVLVKKIQLKMVFSLDESYTPSKLSVRAGTGLHDLQEVAFLNVNEPEGWIDVDLKQAHEE